MGYREWTTYYTSLTTFALILPFYIWHIRYKANSAITYSFHWLTVVFTGIALFVLSLNIRDNNTILWFVLLAAIYLMIGKYLQTSIYYNAYKVAALLCIPICFFIEDFPSFSNNYTLYTTISIVFIYFYLITKYYYIDKKEKILDLVLVFPLLYIFSVYLARLYLYDLVILAFGAYYVWKGFKSERSLVVNYGLTVISIEVAIRFFDSYFPFVLKGIVFILLGVSFFVANYFILKQKKKNA